MKPSSAYTIRNTHSMCLEEHKVQTADRERIRGAKTLTVRAPSYPCHVVDTSVNVIEETNFRRQLHSSFMTEKPSGFKRQSESESSTMVLNEKMLVASMIGDLHQIRDPNDINKNNRYTYSRVCKREVPDREKPLEDFIQPGNQTRERVTGYNQGHIRTILGLDSYGPTSSAENMLERQVGSKPPSPNIDRHSREGNMNLRETAKSRRSTASSRENTGNMKGTFRNKKDAVVDNFILSGEFGASLEMNPVPVMVGKNRDIMAGTMGYYGGALTKEEKQLADTHVKGTTYFEGYKKSLEDRRDIQSLTKKMKEHREKMNKEAERERESIEQFEFRLESAKISGGGV